MKSKNKLECDTILLCCLKRLFGIAVTITLAILICQVYNMSVHCCVHKSWCELIFNEHFLKFLFIACFSILTLYVAGSQLKNQTNIACITALIELRKLLTSENNRNVHFILADKDEQKLLSGEEMNDDVLKENKLLTEQKTPLLDYLNYLGTIELGIIMVKRNLIDWDTFYSQFGYRIENIFDEEVNPVHIKIRKHINDNKVYYKNLFWAKRKIQKNKSK
jgi:hypothetical protein